MAAARQHEHSVSSLSLPSQFCEHIRTLTRAKSFALDIGGSLAKLAYYSTVPKKRAKVLETNQEDGGELYALQEEDELRDQLHFIKFETKYIETCLDFIQQHLVNIHQSMHPKVIKVTGGGGHKYRDLLSRKLGVKIDREDEMQCLITGCNFLLKNIPDEVFMYQRHSNPQYKFHCHDPENAFPYLLVNIGSGVSILKVMSETKYERIGGTSMGGGTFWGLGSLLTKAKGFDELLEMAGQGDHRTVDMLVKDIYGGAYSALGLPADLIASSFGRATRSSEDSEVPGFRDVDMAKALLICISNDIGQIACLHAKLHDLHRIYFGGYFIRGHPLTMYTITHAINYWSKGEAEAMFLRHEGYLGAIGAFMKGVQERDEEKSFWVENKALSSGLQSPVPGESFLDKQPHNMTFDMLEMDKFTKQLVSCPLLLDGASYLPDTEDLSMDEEARGYWLHCFMEATDKFAERAIKSQASTPDAEQRASRFKEKYLMRIEELKANPCAYGSLTVRSLLDTREHCMEEFHFVDPYAQQKRDENEHALQLLAARLKQLDDMEWNERQLRLVVGLLAGNVFDWGAKEAAILMEDLQNFGLKEAEAKLESRPWLVDDFESWLLRLKGPKHQCAVIFADNSGIDIILGVIPFAREMLIRGTQVVLCANSRPALNDVTYNEMTLIAKKVAEICPHIQSALLEGRLIIMESGQGSPCLDLRYIDHDLSEKMKELGADLIVLEGMGRAIHTNLNAAFSCESLKAAVLKNQWLAERLGGDMFSVVFKYARNRKVVPSGSPCSR